MSAVGAAEDSSKASVTVLVDLRHGVGRPDHVEVDVGAYAPPLALAQRAHVVAGAVQADLFGGPEGQANAGARRSRSDRLGRLDHGGRPAPVVVDAGTARHRVEVAPGHHDAVPASARCLRDHVLGPGASRERVHRDAHGAPVAGVAERADGDEHHRDLDPRHRERPARHPAADAHGLDHEERLGARVLRACRLPAEEASAAVDQRDLTLLEPVEVLRGAAVAGRAQAALGAAGARVAQHLELPHARERAAADGERGAADPEVREGNGLPAHRPAGVAEPVRDVVGGGFVAGRPGGARAAAAVGDALERVQVLAELLTRPAAR